MLPQIAPVDKDMEPINAKVRFWQIFALVTLIVIMAAAIRWSLDHPYGAHWDEAQYLNEVAIDTHRLQAGLLLKLGGRILIKTWGRPPAYRVLAVPVLALFGFHTATARLVTLACFGLSAWFIYLATRRIANQVAGAFAVLVFCLSPQVVSASIWFSSEGPLYLAISAMLYYLFAIWTDTSEQSRNWIGLGLGVGLGLLSKSSFVLIGLPVLAFALVVDRWKPLGVSASSSLRKAGVLGLLVAGPWWVLNLKASIAYAGYARDFVRNSLGSPSPATWMRWFGIVLEGLLGYGLSILIALVVIVFVRKVIVRRERSFHALQKLAFGACACAGLPIVLAQLSGTNHLLRHISPAIIPLSIVIGMLADTIGWTRSGAAIAVSSILFCAQLLMILAPVLVPNKHVVDPGLVNGSLPWRIMVRSDQWDWESVKNIGDSCGVDDPKIAYLGAGRPFNQPEIEYPWAVKGTSTDVEWLWRYEEGPLDWQKVTNAAAQSDMVITAPGYGGQISNREDLDNQHNSELAERLFRDPRFREPVRLRMGRFEPVEVLLFLNKNLTCQSQGQAPAIR
jgi:4-amino-4-deoxy-L-arabinose transferase-like glycosyltransferase